MSKFGKKFGSQYVSSRPGVNPPSTIPIPVDFLIPNPGRFSSCHSSLKSFLSHRVGTGMSSFVVPEQDPSLGETTV